MVLMDLVMVIGQLLKCPVVINVPLDPRPQLVSIRVLEVRHSARMTNKRDEDNVLPR